VLKRNSVTSKNKAISIWNFVLNSGLRKFRHGISIVETCYQLSSRKVDAQSVINWAVVGQLSDITSELRRSTTVVYRTDRQALSTARFCRTGQLATADTRFRTSRTSSFCTVAWQLARFQLTRRIARSLGDSWASCWDGYMDSEMLKQTEREEPDWSLLGCASLRCLSSDRRCRRWHSTTTTITTATNTTPPTHAARIHTTYAGMLSPLRAPATTINQSINLLGNEEPKGHL